MTTQADCDKRHSGLNWAIGILVMIFLAVAGGATGVSISANNRSTEALQRVVTLEKSNEDFKSYSQKQQEDVKARMVRIEDKLDKIIEQWPKR